MKLKTLVIVAGIAILAGGCDPEARQAKGFRLPEGNVEAGEKAFVELKCNACHSVGRVQLAKAPSPGQYQVALGGEVLKVKSYGELVTAVIHPAHDIAIGFDKRKIEAGSTPMPEFNETMTVQQMIDMVAFLHSNYKQRQLDYDYPPLGY